MPAARNALIPRVMPARRWPHNQNMETSQTSAVLALLQPVPPFLFFTGKGGVGKTSLSSATALALAEQGRRVLLVSTDAASNLDEMLGVTLSNQAMPVPGVPGLEVINIDPEAAAEAYRLRVIAQLGEQAADEERASVREQLSGACTTEIAAFDEFAGLLAAGGAGYDHVVFDTAPTGHTLRLLSLPKAWSGFLEDNDRGASCLGPHSGLKMQEQRFREALAALTDGAQTRVVLVSRPERSALLEADRACRELAELGLKNQRLIVNGVLSLQAASDAVSRAIAEAGRQALAEMPAALAALPRAEVPRRAFDTIGLPALRALLSGDEPLAGVATPQAVQTQAALRAHATAMPGLDRLADELAAPGRGLIMVMGKGGVGKTTVAAALAIGLVQRGHSVHLSTTDPAAHLELTLDGQLEGLKVDRIDPKAETARHIDKIMASRGAGLDAASRALLLEDLQSPCTEEVAVFHAFSRVVSEARSAFVVLDTAPTGHSLLLMDATGAYHRQMLREFEGKMGGGRVTTPLMRLQDPDYTRIVLVSLPETTPVSQAEALQADLRRANIEPYAWLLNRSILAADTEDALLLARKQGEWCQWQRVQSGLAQRCFVLPWQAEPPVGVAALGRLVGRVQKAAT